MADNIENVEKNEKKKYKSTNRIGVRIVAGFLAFLMVLSVTATAVSYLFVRA